MDYKMHYDTLINRAKYRKVEGPVESHHILPRCMGGSDGKANRVLLTPSEHYVAHQLLVKIHPGISGLALAALLMSRDNRNGKRNNNKEYGWLRRRAAEANSILHKGSKRTPEQCARISDVLRASPQIKANAAARRGIPRTEETRAKNSIAHKTSAKAIAARAIVQTNRLGTKHSDETKAQMSLDRKGRHVSEETKAKTSAALKGKPKSAEHVAKVRAALMGKPGTRLGAVVSEETKAKMRLAATGRKMKPEDIAKMLGSRTPEQRTAASLKAWETKRRNNLLEENRHG